MAVGELIRTEVDLDSLLAQVIDAVTEAMQADRATIYLVDWARGELFSKVAHLPELPEIRLAIGQGIAGYVAETGETINLEHSSADPRFLDAIDRETGYATDNLLCVPVKDRTGEIIGVLQLLNKQAATFDQRDETLLRALASQVAMVIETTSLYTQIRAPTTSPLHYRYNGIVGQSSAMRQIYEVVGKAAATNATVLVTGETGTGKSLIARAIHFNSPRRSHPLIAVDCASLPVTLIENELFGHERGAFTGADRRVIGKFEAANGGTVFLDEIGELPLPIQGRLLRVIQERQFERVGGHRSVKVDVRLIVATNRNLEDMVARQLFREDLYYRLRVIALQLPPLRTRGSIDVEGLAYHFLRVYSERHGKTVRRFDPAALKRLHTHPWPGNIRELENCIEGAVVLAEGPTIRPDDLPLATARSRRAKTEPDWGQLTWEQMERRYIAEVLRVYEGNRSAAARAMGIGRSTLLRKIRQLSITV